MADQDSAVTRGSLSDVRLRGAAAASTTSLGSGSNRMGELSLVPEHAVTMEDAGDTKTNDGVNSDDAFESIDDNEAYVSGKSQVAVEADIDHITGGLTSLGEKGMIVLEVMWNCDGMSLVLRINSVV